MEQEQKVKHEEKLCETLSKQLEVLCEGIKSSIDRINSEVKRVADGSISATKAQFLRLDLQALTEKIDGPLNSSMTQ